MSESYPSWLPKRPPPPVPGSTFDSSAVSHPRAADVFSTQGRKPTSRSVRIIARDVPWREPTGDSAETRVAGPPQRGTAPALPPPPRFGAPSLHLSLLRSPALSMRIQYMIHFVATFAHLIVQTYFDFNIVFMLIQVSSHPGPSNSPRNWSLGAVAYVACWALQVFGVFVVYELIYSFWRRWRVKRPLMLPLYLSAPAHRLVALTSYTHFCFFAYVRRSARPPWSALVALFRPPPTPPMYASPPHSPSPSLSSSASSASTLAAFSDYVAEWCFWRSQNTPTVLLLLPRAALSLSLLLNASPGAPARDPTFFDPRTGALSGYARGILLANAAWTAWRALVLLGSVLGLWILSGTACAGLCGPRYRWEEEHDLEFAPREKHADDLAYPYADDDAGARGMSDGWAWKQGTRARVREAWEFCLTNVRPVRAARGKAAAGAGDEEFAGLDEVLAAAGFAGPRFHAPAHRQQPTVLSREFFAPAAGEGREALSDIIPPADEALGAAAYGSQRSRRSDPLRVLPYPFKEFPQAAGARDGDKGKEREIEGSLIPFPSPVPTPEDDAGDDDDGDDGDGDDGDGDDGDGDEEDVVEGRRTSESMSSLGQPVASRYPFAFRRQARSSGSGSHRTPHSTSASSPARSQSQSQSQSSPSTRGSRSTRPSRSTPSNRESSDSPRSPVSAGSGPFIPPPPAHPHRRRRRAGTAPSLPSSPVPALPAAARTRTRTRTISASTSSASHAHAHAHLEPAPVALYESDDGAARVPSPVADGSQEEAEKEDSVGLLSASAGPSPKGSVAALHRRAGSASRSSSGVSARSRAQSLIQALGQRASLGDFGAAGAGAGSARRSSRASSVARGEESAGSESPRSGVTRSASASGSASASASGGGGGGGSGSASGSGSHWVSGSASGTGTGSGRPSGEGAAPGIEHTFGRPGEIEAQRERLEAEAAALRRAPSDMSGAAPSEATERLLQAPPAAMDESRTDISTANESFVTAPVTIESTTTSEDPGGQGSSTWALRHHVPKGTWGGHEPA